MTLSLFWRRMTSAGVIAGMFGGMLMHLGLTCWGYYEQQEFRAYEFLGLNPFIWDLVGSAVLAVGFSLSTRPDESLVRKYFYRPVR